VVVGFQIINARTSFSLRTLPNFFSVLRSVGQNLFVYCVTFFCRLILILSFIFSRFFAPKKPALLEHRYNELEVLLRVRADERRGQGFERQPFNLSVVIDRSGSMSGRPLKEAVRCAYQFDSWLSGGAGPELLRPWDQRSLQMYPVSRRANSSKAAGDDPTLIERIEE